MVGVTLKLIFLFVIVLRLFHDTLMRIMSNHKKRDRLVDTTILSSQSHHFGYTSTSRRYSKNAKFTVSYLYMIDTNYNATIMPMDRSTSDGQVNDLGFQMHVVADIAKDLYSMGQVVLHNLNPGCQVST